MPNHDASTRPRLALFGATGQVGRRVLDRLLARGLEVRVLVRNAERLDADARVLLAAGAIVEGDARDADAVSRALAGAEVVVSTLGMRDISEPATDLSDSLRTIVGTMPAAGAGRIVAVAAASALPNGRGGYRRDDGVPDMLRHVAAEHVRQFEALRDAPTGVEWTLFCPTFLKPRGRLGSVRMAAEMLPAGSDITGLDDLADAIVNEVMAPRFMGHRVGIVSDAA